MFSGRARFLNGVKRQFGKCAIARSRNSGSELASLLASAQRANAGARRLLITDLNPPAINVPLKAYSVNPQ
jgi:hypothetical protein